MVRWPRARSSRDWAGLPAVVAFAARDVPRLDEPRATGSGYYDLTPASGITNRVEDGG